MKYWKKIFNNEKINLNNFKDNISLDNIVSTVIDSRTYNYKLDDVYDFLEDIKANFKIKNIKIKKNLQNINNELFSIDVNIAKVFNYKYFIHKTQNNEYITYYDIIKEIIKDLFKLIKNKEISINNFTNGKKMLINRYILELVSKYMNEKLYFEDEYEISSFDVEYVVEILVLILSISMMDDYLPIINSTHDCVIDEIIEALLGGNSLYLIYENGDFSYEWIFNISGIYIGTFNTERKYELKGE